ncbi:MAG: nuclease-related domain-containing protein [Pelobium sp.]
MDYTERLYNELIIEESLLWYVYTDHTTKIMVKAPTIALKSIFKGCKVELLFGKDLSSEESFFHIGIKIHDIPTNGLIIIKTSRFIEDHISLHEVMKQERTYVEFYNELNMCCMYSYLSIDSADRNKVLTLLENLDQLYSGDLNDKAIHSLDCFEYSIDESFKISNVGRIDILKISIVFSGLKTLIIDYVGLNESNEIILDDSNEGDYFEKQIWALLDNIFPFNTYKNPIIIKNSKTRELTDIFAYYDKGVFLIEIKAMAVLNIKDNQLIERKISNVQKQIFKAIKQLVGAKKVIANKTPIFSTNRIELKFKKEITPHCIVLVNELIPFGNWKKIENEIFKTINIENIHLNVLDHVEFMKYVIASNGSKEFFDNLLIERVKFFIEKKNIFLKSSY